MLPAAPALPGEGGGYGQTVRDGEGGDVWDALTTIFSDMDSQGGAGVEQEALEETLESLRGLLDMHLQLRRKTAGLDAKRAQMEGERDAALDRLAELERAEASNRRRPRSDMQQAWEAYEDIDHENPQRRG